MKKCLFRSLLQEVDAIQYFNPNKISLTSENCIKKGNRSSKQLKHRKDLDTPTNRSFENKSISELHEKNSELEVPLYSFEVERSKPCSASSTNISSLLVDDVSRWPSESSEVASISLPYDNFRFETKSSDRSKSLNSDETSVTSIESYFETVDPILLLNKERAGIGIPPLSRLFDLESAAKIHALNMAKFDGLYYFAKEFLPLKFTNRNDKGQRRVLKEIILYAESVQNVHELMMAFDYERSNMLSTAFSFVGVGIATGTHDVYYACYLFW